HQSSRLREGGAGRQLLGSISFSVVRRRRPISVLPRWRTSPSRPNKRRSAPCPDGGYGPMWRVDLRRMCADITASPQLPVQRRLPTGGSNLCGTGTAAAGTRAPQKASLSLAKDARADSLEVDVLGSTPALPPAAVGGKACLMARAGDHAIAPARLAISASIQA